MSSNLPLILFIDLFAGAGGVSTGADRARMLGEYRPVKLIAAVNHDPLAIESHKTNHPQALHFNEDVRAQSVIDQVAEYTNFMRKKYPEAIVLLWASMECTNYSKAKGGMPRDADSRSLPNIMPKYIDALNPDLFYFENVDEFRSWGPLDENGRPISMKKGIDYLCWVDKIRAKGYSYDFSILNAADFGAHTKRKRLFGIFSNGKVPIIWPSPTHAEKPTKGGFFGELKPYNPVYECLDFSDEGTSIFTRKKPLVEATLKRIYAGMNKYVAKGDGVFIHKNVSGHPASKSYSVRGPAHTITTKAHQSVVKCAFNTKYYGNGDNTESINNPAGTLRTKDGFMLVQGSFIDKSFSGVHNHQSVTEPAGSIPTKDHYAVVSAFFDKQYGGELNHESITRSSGALLTNPKQCLVRASFMDRQFSQGTQHESVDRPSGAITTVPKMNLVQAYLMNPQYNSKGGSVEDPCFTLIARMDKAPPSLIKMEYDFEVPEFLQVKKSDSPTMKLIKEFCHQYGITDVTTRMLRVPELLRIQGFGDDYKLLGTQTDQKKFIGNSVPPAIVRALMEALSNKLYELNKEVLAA